MNDEYKIANITKEEREELTKLENNLSEGKDKHVVLVAYETKENKA